MSSLEYLFVIIAILAGIVAMYPILRQSIGSRYREASDAFGSGRQYEPYGPHKTNITSLAEGTDLCVTMAESICGYQCTRHSVENYDSCRNSCCNSRCTGIFRFACLITCPILTNMGANHEWSCWSSCSGAGPCPQEAAGPCTEHSDGGCNSSCYEKEFKACADD